MVRRVSELQPGSESTAPNPGLVAGRIPQSFQDGLGEGARRTRLKTSPMKREVGIGASLASEAPIQFPFFIDCLVRKEFRNSKRQ